MGSWLLIWTQKLRGFRELQMVMLAVTEKEIRNPRIARKSTGSPVCTCILIPQDYFANAQNPSFLQKNNDCTNYL
jgi:hypothetical protein